MSAKRCCKPVDIETASTVPGARGPARMATWSRSLAPARWLGLVPILAAAATAVEGQSLGGSGLRKENLDLPYEALRAHDEEACEFIEYYDLTIEGNAFIFVIDRSGTMLDSGELAVAKREVVSGISSLSRRSEFACLFFDRGLLRFPPNGKPVAASPAAKAACQGFVETVEGGGGTCCQEALTEALRLAELCRSKRRAIIFVTDGGGTCDGGDEAAYLEETLAIIKGLNIDRVPIHCLGVVDVGALQDRFLSRLADSSGGRYRKVARCR